jgi:hypothetical protein
MSAGTGTEVFRTGMPHRGIAPGKEVVFFPTDADFAAGRWHVPVHGRIYRPTDTTRLRRAGLALIKRALRKHVPADETAMALFRERVGAFLADNERWERGFIQLGEAIFKLKRSHANGHFTGSAELPEQHVAALVGTGVAAAAKDATWASFRAITRGGDARLFDGRVRLLPPEGWSVISDIDDTIKVTQVASRRSLLRNTFVRPFAAVPEMAALYRHWQENLGAAVHYLSASPWHLYPFLEEFLAAQGFPQGTFYLRHFRLMPAGLPATLRAGRRVKLAHARTLLSRFPRRRFILVGDSGESDAAIYARLYQEYPRQVERICIRNLGGEAGQRVCMTALQNVPRNLWRVFIDPAEAQ